MVVATDPGAKIWGRAPWGERLKVLVLGRDGQVARSIAESAADFPDLELVFTSRAEADLSSSGSVAAAIAASRPGLVINAAAYTAVDKAEEEPSLAFRVNAEGAGEAAAAARDVGATFVQLSTDYVFDGRATQPYDEDAPVNPLSVYGRSKLAGEEAVRAANPDHLILRTAWVYSPFGRNFVKSMMEAAREREMLTVVADQHGSPTSALDLADAILSIAGRGALSGETYHLAGSGSASWFELASEVMTHCARLGLPAAKVQSIRTADWPTRAARPSYAVLDCTKAELDLGVRLPDWRQSVARTVERLAEA
jgi:dTDP-4-dehydrorhamnose reductase